MITDDLKLKIVFTHHAIDELKLFNIPIKKAFWMIKNSFPEKAPDHKYKKEKYGQSQNNIAYWRQGSVIFTTKKTKDKHTNEPILLVISVADQLIMLKK